MCVRDAREEPAFVVQESDRSSRDDAAGTRQVNCSARNVGRSFLSPIGLAENGVKCGVGRHERLKPNYSIGR